MQLSAWQDDIRKVLSVALGTCRYAVAGGVHR